MKSRYILPAALAVLSSAVSQAIPAYPGPILHTQPDGAQVTLYLKGDEKAHSFVTDEGYLVSIDQAGAARFFTNHSVEAPLVSEKALSSDWLSKYGTNDLEAYLGPRRAAAAPKHAVGIETFPSKGNLKGIVILAEFADNSFSEEFTLEYAKNKMNKEGFNEKGATGSVRDYFISQSSGQFTPEFDVIGPVKLPEKLAYYGENTYGGNDVRPAEMIQSACQIAHDDFGTDFTKYDYDNDGYVDFVYVIYAGYAESYGASSNTIWPHSSNLSRLGYECELDGKKIDLYACSSELREISGTTPEGIGPFVHEFSHVLGLPDIYNISSSATIQLGAWDVMDIGPYNNNCNTPPNYSAYERYMVGWLQFVELTEPDFDVICPEMSANNFAYIIKTDVENDVYTVENRQQVGWDKYHPGTGLMILHIYYVPQIWAANMVNVNYQYYNLMEADGSQGILQETDLYPQPDNDMFTYFSSPGMFTAFGDPVEKGISKIRDDNGVIHFRFMKDRMAPPASMSGEDITPSSFTAVWDEVEDATIYDMKIREILPDDMNPLIFSEDFDGMKHGSISKPDPLEIGMELNGYMGAEGWIGLEIYSAGGNVMIGKFNTSGQLLSPVIHSDEKSLTLAFSQRSYTGKQADCNVTIVEEGTNKVIKTMSFKATKTETDQMISFIPPAAGFRIYFTTTNERCFLTRLRVVKGELSEEELWTCGPKTWELTDINDNRVVVEDLVPDREYACSLRSRCDEEYRTSLYSEEFLIRTVEDTGVGTVASEAPGTTYFDLTGRRVAPTTPGVLIRRSADASGSVSIRKVIVR